MDKVLMLPRAAQDLEEIVEYLSGFYLSVALDQYDRLVSKINEITSFPFRYPEYKTGRFKLPYRRMVVDDYLVFYVVSDDEIVIHRILHEKRNVSKYFDQEE